MLLSLQNAMRQFCDVLPKLHSLYSVSAESSKVCETCCAYVFTCVHVCICVCVFGDQYVHVYVCVCMCVLNARRCVHMCGVTCTCSYVMLCFQRRLQWWCGMHTIYTCVHKWIHVWVHVNICAQILVRVFA